MNNDHFKRIISQVDKIFTLCAKLPFRRLVMDDGVIAFGALALGIVTDLHAQRVDVSVGTRLVVEALLPQLLRYTRRGKMNRE